MECQSQSHLPRSSQTSVLYSGVVYALHKGHSYEWTMLNTSGAIVKSLLSTIIEPFSTMAELEKDVLASMGVSYSSTTPPESDLSL